MIALGRVRDRLDGRSGRLAFRWWVAGCQAFTILVTWQLWQVRTFPPLLPALPLPSIDMGALLLLSLVIVLLRPRLGLPIHTGMLIYAMLVDQTRIQPEVLSLAFLLWGTLDSPAARTLARFQLVAMWLWAGTNKLLSPVFVAATGRAMMSVLLGFLPHVVLQNAGIIIGLTEVGIGILSLLPRTRLLAALIAFGLHIGILLTLIAMHWNSSVWAWNVALAVAGFALIWTWKDNPIKTLRARGWLVRIAAAVLLVSPIGFYFGVVDAYLAYNLYSSNTPDADAPTSPTIVWSLLNVPMPPEHRLYEQFFQLTCQPNEQMRIRDTRPYFVANGAAERIIQCQNTHVGYNDAPAHAKSGRRIIYAGGVPAEEPLR